MSSRSRLSLFLLARDNCNCDPCTAPAQMKRFLLLALLAALLAGLLPCTVAQARVAALTTAFANGLINMNLTEVSSRSAHPPASQTTRCAGSTQASLHCGRPASWRPTVLHPGMRLPEQPPV